MSVRNALPADALPRMVPLLVNILSFQAGWFASVLGAARGSSWLGPAVLVPLVAFHLARAVDRRTEALILAASGVAGLLAETAMIAAGFYLPAVSPFPAPLAPPWLVAMWVNFGTTLSVSLRFLEGRPVLAALLGAAAGPLAYLAGEGLGAIRFPDPRWPGIMALAVLWGAAVPGLFLLRGRLSHSPLRPNR